MPYVAKHRFAPMSPKKVRLVANVIRRMNVDDALDTLRFMPQRGARLIEKVLLSAKANAEEQGEIRPGNLYVRDIRVDDGPRMKRLRPRWRGTAHIILRRTCHISVVLDTLGEREEEEYY